MDTSPFQILFSTILLVLTIIAAKPEPQQASPESATVLEMELNDLLAAERVHNDATVDSIRKSFLIPNYSAWFLTTFGDSDGPVLAAEYGKEVQEFDSVLDDAFSEAIRNSHMIAQVVRFQNSDEAVMPWVNKDILIALKQPMVLYEASAKENGKGFAHPLGYFFYIDGRFRRLDPRTLGLLSTVRAHPMRIKVGGNVQVASLQHSAKPEYPPEALANRVQGDVVFHVVVGIDGLINQADVIQGDPTLAQAALAAVRQWKYKPPVLNGWLVEVDSTVSVSFKL